MNQKMNLKRRYPVGAELQPNGGTHFRVWAPRPKKMEVLLEAGPGAPATVQLKRQEDGYFAGLVPSAALTQSAAWYLQVAGFSEGQVLENALANHDGPQEGPRR